MPTSRPLECHVVDRWMKVSLAARYAATLQEPVPDSLLKLLDRI